MSKWIKLSYERKKMIHNSAMMLVAKKGKAKGFLNFDGEKLTCPEDATFTLDVGEGVTGTVNLSNHGCENWAYVVMDFKTVLVEGYLQLVEGTLKLDWLCQAYSRGGIPDAIVDFAENPITMNEVLA